jgi:hypothetical protein
MAWISGTGTYFLARNYEAGRQARFPANALADDEFDGEPCRAFDVDLRVPAHCVIPKPCVSLGVSVVADWGIRDIANRTRTTVGVASIHLVIAAAAAYAGTVAAYRMTRVDSSVPERAACAFVPIGDGGGRAEAMALAAYARKAMATARRTTELWTRTTMRRVDALQHLDEASAHLKTARWEAHCGILPPELFFAPRYPEGGPFCEVSYVRALERARFVTAGVEPDEILRWCAGAERGDPASRLCACTLLGRMLCAFGLCIAYTPDVLLHPESAARASDSDLISRVKGLPGVLTEYCEQFQEPLQTMTGDCEECAKYILAAALFFQRIGPGFSSPVLKALASLARCYVFSATSCLLPLSASPGGSMEERESGQTSVAGDPLELELNCTAHVTCIGIPRREYFAALSGVDTLASPAFGLPTIVMEGAGLTHPLIAPHGTYLGSEEASKMAGSSIICDAAHRRWKVDALRRLRTAGIKCKTASSEYSMPDAKHPFYRTFVHAFTWPVEGLLPDPPCRASFCTGDRIGASWETVVDPLGRGLRILAYPPMPPQVLAASRLILDHVPPPLDSYCTPRDQPFLPPALSTAFEGASTTDVAVLPDPRARRPEHIVLSMALCDLPLDPREVSGLLKTVFSAVVGQGSGGTAECVVNSVGVDRGECLLRIVARTI